MEKPTRNKKIGIICDDYKVPRFKKELKARGYEFSIKAGPTYDTKMVKVKAAESEIPELDHLCRKINFVSQAERR